MPEPEKLRIAFFGTAEFAAPSLEALVSAGHHVIIVVSQPDRPQGRGRHLVPSPVKEAARRLGLPVVQPKRVRSARFVEMLRELRPDIIALAAFGQIVPQALLDLPRLGPINVHGSLLPKYRGAAPIQRAIMAGERETGVTTMWMDAALDTGNILLKQAIAITPEDTAGSLTPKLAIIGAELLVRTVDGLASGTLVRAPQDDTQSTLAPAIKQEEGDIPWADTADAISCRVRGLNPKPGAYTAFRGKRLKIWSAWPAASPADGAERGRIIELLKKPHGLVVACGSHTALVLIEVQPESGRRMPAADWARGIRAAPGETMG
jgi:methionyl-tRNA formyltransferase